MLFGKERTKEQGDGFNSFTFSLRQKSRTPISQSINFSEEALQKAVTRKILSDRSYSSSNPTYTTLGLLNITPKGHLIDTKA